MNELRPGIVVVIYGALVKARFQWLKAMPYTHVLLVDNTETPNTNASLWAENYPHFSYHSMQGNKGIGAALNQGFRLCREWGLTHVLTMDQDSGFEQEAYDHYLDCLRYVDWKKTGQTGVNHEGRGGGSNAACNAIERNALITSGSMVSIEAWERVGGFNENLFIDLVDFDFSFRLVEAGFNNLYFSNIIMDHKLGKQKEVKNLGLGPRVERNLHGNFRLFYMIRNYRYMRQRYGSLFPKETKAFRKFVLVKIKNELLYGIKPLQTVATVYKGLKAKLPG